jgi:iron complex transport system ATP-binding protein
MGVILMKIEIKNLDFNYSHSVQVLHDINLSLEGPGLVCIVGPNGVGKSTLIKCINGLLKPTSGTVSVNGKNVRDMKRKELAMEVGYVPPSTTDMFSIPVLDAVMIGRHNLQGWKNSQEDIDKVYDILRLMNIEDLAMRSFNSLSSGRHQKVSLARGLAQETEILILDEPTSNLDVKYQVYVTEMLRGIAEEKNILILMISHDLNIAAKYSNEIIVMSEPGRIYSYGKPEDVITCDMVRKVYGIDCGIYDRNGIKNVVLGFVMSM